MTVGAPSGERGGGDDRGVCVDGRIRRAAEKFAKGEMVEKANANREPCRTANCSPDPEGGFTGWEKEKAGGRKDLVCSEREWMSSSAWWTGGRADLRLLPCATLIWEWIGG